MGKETPASALTEDSQVVYHSIREWFSGALGEHVLRTEQAMLDQLLPTLFGYHLTQFSVQNRPLFEASPIQNKFSVHLESGASDQAGVISKPVQLPFANDSLDVVLLHHLLDFAQDPKEILREVTRVTMPMGHMVIVGFNPLSSWGLWRSIARYKGNPPWNGEFIRPARLMDWLNLLEFKIDRAQYAIYRPPFSRFPGKVTDYSHGVSRNLNLPVGSVYVIVARKHVGAVRSIRPVWNRHRAFGRVSAVQSVKHDGLAVTPISSRVSTRPSKPEPPQND